MESENWNLSDKIVYKDLDGFDDEFLWKKDVRKFIKKTKNMLQITLSNVASFKEAIKELDKFAGEKLI